MINARIFDGDILFVKSQSSVDNGDIAVILIDDEATVKRVYIDYNDDNTVSIVTLIPENPMYRPMRYVGHTLDSVRILGKVVAGQHRVR
jgi:repressor LexA